MQLGESNWRQVPDLTGKVVVAPIGSFEQHGHHLPLLTDSLIGGEVALRAEEALGEEAVFLPMLWLGASDHHRSFPGTISLSSQTYTNVLKELIDSLIGSGFRRIFLLNSHAGNIVPAQMAINEKNIEYRQELPNLYLAFVSWFDLLPKDELAALTPSLQQTQISHACEWETSVLQVTSPDLVGPDRPSTRRTFESPYWSADFRKPSRVFIGRALEQSSPTGALGYPERADPEKGEALLRIATREVVAFVRDFATWPDTLGPETLESQP
ncbi:MAG: creatininase family protein [Capsulimonadales bacterium]|nr:creatininase family protein [Capsulimonadales bacterium]